MSSDLRKSDFQYPDNQLGMPSDYFKRMGAATSPEAWQHGALGSTWFLRGGKNILGCNGSMRASTYVKHYVTTKIVQDSQLNQRDLADAFDKAFLFNCLNMFQ